MRLIKFTGVFLVLALILLSKLDSAISVSQQEHSSKIQQSNSDLSQQDFYFICNKGQVDQQALFYTHTEKYTLWLTSEGLIFDQIENKQNRPAEKIDSYINIKSARSQDVKRRVSSLIFHGANPRSKIIPLNTYNHKVNYLIGRDESQWRTNIPTCGAVKYENLYPHIDLKVYSREGRIEYDWIIKPGGHVSDIQFEYRDVDNIDVDSLGNLSVHTSFGEFIHARPYAFQNIDGKKIEIAAAFKRKSINTFVFETRSYDSDRTLIIDPLIYSTYIGGSKSDFGEVVAIDSKGAVYIGGDTYSADFPTKKPFHAKRKGTRAVFITKIKRTGKKMVYSTYLGGAGLDYARGIAVDSQGNVYIAGWTSSSDFPIKKAFQSEKNGEGGDLFVTKLGPKGNTLIYSTYIGGSTSEQLRDIAVNKQGSVYVAGYTESFDYPMKNPIKGNKDGYRDGFVTKFHPKGNKLIYSTYLGGEDTDRINAVAVDERGSAYVVGQSASSDFPTKNPFQNKLNGYDNAVVCKIDPKGKRLLYSTYLGGSCSDYAYGVAVDSEGCAYVIGQVHSTDFPLKNPIQGVKKGVEDAFVTKFNPKGNALVYSTYLGGTDSELGHGIAVDKNGCACVTGITISQDFPMVNPFENKNPDKYGVFFARIIPSGTSLSLSSYIGGSDKDKAFRVAVDSRGYAYVIGYTDSKNMLTKNALQNENKGETDVFLVKIK